MARLRTNKRFDNAFRQLPPNVRKQVAAALEKFVDNPSRPGLNFEPIVGRPGCYSIRAGRAYRILLLRDHDKEGEIFTAANVGRHDIYRRLKF